MSIHKSLFEIQQKLIVPKSQRNDFGGYNFRSAEDILEALKNITDCAITLNDELVMVGERYYIKATATIFNDKGEGISSTAFAREADSRKGMGADQLTGACSSYARKYALNALFAIDDTKDSDTLDNRHELSKTEKDKQQENTLNEMLKLIEDNDKAFVQVWHELGRNEQSKYWKLINSKQQSIARELIEQSK